MEVLLGEDVVRPRLQEDVQVDAAAHQLLRVLHQAGGGGEKRGVRPPFWGQGGQNGVGEEGEDSLEDFGDALGALDLAIAAQEAVQALEELLGVDGAGAHGKKP